MPDYTLAQLHSEFLRSSGICTDTRRLEKNSIFFALKGDHFDGNRFAEEALGAGCRLVVTEREDLRDQEGFCHATSSLRLLQELANYHRHQVNPGVLAITGSNGKTTTKELCAAVLSRKYKVLATRGNLNNHIGVPLTLLSLRDEEVAVVEMGANHPGEIKTLAGIANPMLGLITNVGKAHLEGFGSLEGVLEAKAELYGQLAAHGGTAIVDGLDERLVRKAGQTGVDILLVSPEGDLSVDARILEQRPYLRIALTLENLSFTVDSKLVGAYNLQNIRLAAGVGLRMGVAPQDIVAAIEAYRPENQRSQLVEGGRNRVILDSYNANPSSMREALTSLVEHKEDKCMAILGDMAELGESTRAEHEALLTEAQRLGIGKILVVGPVFSEVGEPSSVLGVFRDRLSLERWLKEEKPEGYLILVKGSRVNELEKILPLLS